MQKKHKLLARKGPRTQTVPLLTHMECNWLAKVSCEVEVLKLRLSSL